MIPTARLRFVKRTVPIQGEPYSPHGSFGRVVQILQQWWWDEEAKEGEWRDVPLEDV